MYILSKMLYKSYAVLNFLIVESIVLFLAFSALKTSVVYGNYFGTSDGDIPPKSLALILEAFNKMAESIIFPLPQFRENLLVENAARTTNLSQYRNFDVMSILDSTMKESDVRKYFEGLFFTFKNILDKYVPYRYPQVFAVSPSEFQKLTQGSSNHPDSSGVSTGLKSNEFNVHEVVKLGEFRGNFDRGMLKNIPKKSRDEMKSLYNRKGKNELIVIKNEEDISFKIIHHSEHVMCDSVFATRVQIMDLSIGVNKYPGGWVGPNTQYGTNNEDIKILVRLGLYDENDVLRKEVPQDFSLAVIEPFLYLRIIDELKMAEGDIDANILHLKEKYIKNFRGVLVCARKGERAHLLSVPVFAVQRYIDGPWIISVQVHDVALSYAPAVHGLGSYTGYDSRDHNSIIFTAKIALGDTPFYVTEPRIKNIPFVGKLDSNTVNMLIGGIGIDPLVREERLKDLSSVTAVLAAKLENQTCWLSRKVASVGKSDVGRSESSPESSSGTFEASSMMYENVVGEDTYIQLKCGATTVRSTRNVMLSNPGILGLTSFLQAAIFFSIAIIPTSFNIEKPLVPYCLFHSLLAIAFGLYTWSRRSAEIHDFVNQQIEKTRRRLGPVSVFVMQERLNY